MTNDMYYIVDTNELLDNVEILKEYNVVILSHVIRELEKHKRQRQDEELRYQARRATRAIRDSKNTLKIDLKDYTWKQNDEFDKDYVDNKILQCCIDNGFGLITNDLLLEFKAEMYNIPIINSNNVGNYEENKGYKIVHMIQSEYNDFFYNRLYLNEFDLKVNDYLIVMDDVFHYDKLEDAKVIGVFKYDGNFYNQVKEKTITTSAFPKFKPKDAFQICVLDSLYENKMTMIKGKAGSGKSLIALNYAMQQIEKNKYDKLICFVNPVASKNSAKLGYYPGSRDEKLLDSSVGSMLASKFGEKLEVETMIAKGELMLLPFSDIRGFDTTGMKAIVYIIEAQNLDIDLMKLAIQRVGDDSKLIIDGDYNSQVDSKNYEGANNGMRRVSEIFRNQRYFGEVELPIIYRSEMAKQADLM